MILPSTTIIFVVLYFSVSEADLPNLATGVWLNKYIETKGARCLDGTPPLYYIRKASSSQNSTKWVIHQQGGGWCIGLEDCYQRSQTRLGSTLPKYGFMPVMDLGTTDGCDNARWCGGLFVNDPKKNPFTYDWNAVFIIYCDGGSQIGNNATVTEYNGTRLYFSGFNNLDSVITDLLENQGMNKATHVIVGGDSAGGLATWIHTDYWASRLPSTAIVVGVPDSGFFIEQNSKTKHYETDLKWVFKQHNGTAGVHPDCAKFYAKTNNIEECIFAQNVAPFCKTPMFALQSKFDEYQIGEIIGSNDPSIVNPFGLNLKDLMVKNFLSKPQNGVFLDSCVHHCGGWGMQQDGDYLIVIDGFTGLNAFASWFWKLNDKQLWEQPDVYPCSSCCNGGGIDTK